MTETKHALLAEEARLAWAEMVWPNAGDMGAMLYGVAFDAGVIVDASTHHPVEWIEHLTRNPPPRGVLDWCGWVGTAYMDFASTLEQAQGIASAGLQENPTPTTTHVLLATIATKDNHVSVTSWELELPELVFGKRMTTDKPDNEPEGAVPDALRALIAITS